MRTTLCKIFTAAIIGVPLLAGSGRGAEMPLAQLLPEGAPFRYVAEKEEWDQMPVALPVPEQMRKMIPRYPDFFAPCSTKGKSPVTRMESNLELQRSESEGFRISWPSKGEPLFRWSLKHALVSTYRADLHIYCVSVFRSGDGFVRCLVPLGAGSECISIENAVIEFNDEGMSGNMSRRLSSVAGVKLPPVVLCRRPDGKEDSFSLANAVSLSLRCRIVPRSLLTRHDAGELAAMPWDTVELASWNAAKKSEWRADAEASIKLADPQVQESLAGCLSNHFHNVWTNAWVRAWHGAIEGLDKNERDALPADVKEQGEAAVRSHCDAFFATLGKEAAGKILPPALVATIRGNATGEAGVLSGLQFNVTSIIPAVAGKREYPWKQDRVAVFRQAMALLQEAPEGVRLAVLQRLKLKDEKGDLVAVEPDPVFILSVDGTFGMTLQRWPGFARSPEPGNAPEREVPVSGMVLEWASACPEVQFQVLAELETPEGRKRASSVKLTLPVNAPVVAAIKRAQ